MANFTTWEEVRDKLMTAEEKTECDKWLAEFGKLLDKRDSGEITEMEYRKLCFELDKKQGIAEDVDENSYLYGDDEDATEFNSDYENNLVANF